MRLLLLARTAGAWRSDRVDPSPQLAVLADDRIVVELSPVEPTLAGRETGLAGRGDRAGPTAGDPARLPAHRRGPRWPRR